MKTLLILSGGMDSVTLLHDLRQQGHELEAISFNYGQRHKKELEYAKENCEFLDVPHKIVDLSNLNSLLQGSALTDRKIEVPEGHYEQESMKATVVPNRNMIMLSIAGGYAISIKAERIAYAAHAGDHAIYPDCRKVFMRAMQTAFELCDFAPLELYAPYAERRLTKADICRLGLAIGVDYTKTWTCYKGSEIACGKCGTDVERLEAFHLSGVEDPIEYEDREFWRTAKV